MVQTRSTTASITSQQSIPHKTPNSFDIPHEVVLKIAEFLHIDDLNNLRQCNRRLSRIIGESCLFRYRIQPTFQAALAYALATDNVALWYYAFDNKKENDKVEYFEIAYMFLVRKSMDPTWSCIFVMDIVPKLTPGKSTILVAVNNVLKDRPYYKPFEDFDLSSLEHDPRQVPYIENEFKHVEVVGTSDIINKYYVYDNIELNEIPWKEEAWKHLRDRGFLHLWKNQLLDVAAQNGHIEMMKRLLLIKAKASDDTLQKLLKKISVTDKPSWDIVEMVIFLTKQGLKIRKPFLLLAIIEWTQGIVLLQHLLDHNIMDSNIQLELFEDLLKFNYKARNACTMVVKNLCAKNLIDVRQKNEILFLLISFGMTKLVVTLLSHGAQLEALNECRQTPLLFAKLQGKVEIEKYLLLLGANRAVVDATGRSYDKFSEIKEAH